MIRQQPLRTRPDGSRGDHPPATPTVVEAIRAHAAARPEAPALVSGDTTWTHADLARRIDRTAAVLADLDVAGRPVVVFARRGPETTAAMLAVMAARGASVPVDTGATAAWLEEIVADARPAAIIADDAHLEAVSELGVPVVFLDHLPTPSGRAPVDGPRPGDAAYVIYTSGSTGRPKGVVVEHSQLSAYIDNFSDYYRMTSASRTVQFHALSFDASVEDLFLPLACGGSVVHLEQDRISTIDRFLSWCGHHRVTHLSIPTAFFHEIVNGIADGAPWPDSVGTVMFGGEAARPDAVARWTDVMGENVRLLNAYGPTEVTVVCTASDLTGTRPEGAVPIGRPIGTNRAYVLDADGEPVPPGEEGELVMGGPQVARGYLGRNDLTAERFLPDPFAPPVDPPTPGPPGSDAPARDIPAQDRSDHTETAPTMYRTGDLVSIRADGELVYHGRIDRQVKVRGYRIELPAVEAALARHPAVRDCVVTALKSSTGSLRLVAHVVPSAGHSPADLEDLQGFLGSELPGFMIPESVVAIERIPLTTSGKVDEKALPDPFPDSDRSTGPSEVPFAEVPGVPAGVVEEVARIWSEVLDRPDIDAAASFFELGGHSLSAIRMLSEVRRSLGVELRLEQLFGNDTLPRFARLVAATGIEPGADRPNQVEAPPDGERLPLSPAQERMWVINRLEPSSLAYVIPELTLLEGPLDVDALRQAHAVLVERHAILRTRYAEVDGVPHQVVDPPGPPPFQVFDVTDTADGAVPGGPDAEERARHLVEHWMQVPLDLVRGPVWRVVVVRVGVDRHLMLTMVHHIATDGDSFEIAAEEISELYRAALDGRTPALPDPGISYAEHALRQHRMLESGALDHDREWWKERLTGVAPLDLPADRPRPDVRSMEGSTERFEVAGATEQAVNGLASRFRATHIMIGLALFSAFVHRLTDAERFVVGVPSSDRDGADTDGVMGLFVNSLPVLVDAGADVTFSALVESIRESAVASYARRSVPFDEIVRATLTRRDPGRNPVFDVMFQYGVLARESALDLPGVTTRTLPDDGTGTDLDLTMELDLRDSRLVGSITYSTDLFDRETVLRMVDQFSSLTTAALSEPDLRLAELPLVDTEHQQRIVEEFGGAGGGEQRLPDPIDDLVTAVAAEPTAPALIDDQGTITRGELADRAADHAEALGEAGVEEGDVVALILPPGREMVAAQWAVHAVGAAFVPLDPRLPPRWIETAARGAGVSHAIAEPDAVPLDLPLDVVVLDLPTGSTTDRRFPTAAATRPDAAACILYASGAAADPLGTPISRSGLAVAVDAARRVAALEKGDVVAVPSPSSSGTVIGELLAAIADGATVVFLPEDAARPESLLAFLDEHRVTVAHLPIHIWPPLLTGATDGVLALPATLRTVSVEITAGSTELLRRWRTVFHGRTVPIYRPRGIPGPVAAGGAVGERPDRLRPVGGSSVYVLDAGGRPCPIGVPGQVHVGGGYLPTDEEATGPVFERVLPDPYRGDEMLRTEDRARWTVDGALELVETDDRSVDLGGVRIDIRHIAEAVASHPAVDGAEAVVGDGGTVQVFVTPEAGSPHRDDLAEFLADILPREAIPSRVVAQPRLDPTAGTPSEGPILRPPGDDPLVEAMCTLWEEVLDTPALPDSDFFELGGSSLLAIRLLSLIERRHSISLPLTAIFDSPTPAGLVAECRSAGAGGDPRVFSISDGPAPELFCFNPGGGGFSLYRPLGLRMSGERGLVGVLSRGADGLATPDRDVAGIAEHWADVIIDHTGGRNIHLLGYSDGGVKAFETAREIERRGVEVGFFGVIDTFLPPPHTSNSPLVSIARELSEEGIGDGLAATWTELRSYLGRARHAPRWHLLRARGRRLPPDLTLRRLNHASDIAFRRYRYDGGSVSVPVTLFRAAWHGPEHRPQDSWSRATTSEVRVVDVPGMHSRTDALVDEPHVQYLAKAMSEALGGRAAR